MGTVNEGIVLSDDEVRALYRILKPSESGWSPIELNLLGRIELYLYKRMTIEEIEDLKEGDWEESP